MAKIEVKPSSFIQSIKDGFGLGVGVSIAQHAVNGAINMLIPSSKNEKMIEYDKCMKYSENDKEKCKRILENNK